MATTPSQGLFLKRQIAILVVAVVLIAVVVAALVLSSVNSARQDKWNTLLRHSQATATVLNNMLLQHSSDNTGSFFMMSNNISNIRRQVTTLTHGNANAGIPPIPASAQVELKAVTTIWKPMDEDAHNVDQDSARFDKTLSAIHAGAVALTTTYGRIAQAAGVHVSTPSESVTGLLGTLTGAPGAGHPATTAPTGAPQLIADQLKRLASLTGSTQAPSNQSAVAPNQRAEAIGRSVQNLANDNQRLASDDNPQIAGAARIAQAQAKKLVTAAATLSTQGEQLEQALRVAQTMYFLNAPNLSPALGTLALVMQQRDHAINQRYRIIAYVAGGLAILALALFAALFGIAQLRLRRTAERNDQHQQQAILRLLDEITNLSNGDLTGNMTVTEDFTGAIADSINYTVETLRGLVGTINHTSTELVNAAGHTSEAAAHMSRDSQTQAQDITRATTTITESSQHLQRVSGQAQKLAEQANTSVQTAHTGAETVNHTIESMTALREQIQDTAKRIKRLGESSQEIGNITEVIDDIAEQTNTLALNASIQAAMAGEAGRGFAVVASEVQRLAERATSATRRIETLVKTIQTDTNEAIVSMERSTSNVVSGAQSAEEAGKALGNIEESSLELAQTIAQISDAARDQSEVATRIATNMQSIRQIAVQTSGSADQTSKQVSELNALSDRLRESVSGFKLPAEDTVPVAVSAVETAEPAAAAAA
ncbi:MAG TPA: methyl-accepting chemotaxis protein [Nevskiaceae bacterium]|nr:methyl-accepting chemotaxis protein [Nevskiaceae bacterium]